MKKAYTIVLLVAACAALIPTLVFAEETTEDDYSDDEYLEEYIDEADVETSDVLDEEDFFDDSDTGLSDYDSPGKYIKVRGKWGNAGDKEFDGYFGGRITLRNLENGKRVGVFKGLYNKTGEPAENRIVGIMKKGYFLGKIIGDEGEIKISGLYTIDREQHLLKMQWMVPRHAGWAVARISLVES